MFEKRTFYLDYNSTAPLSGAVIKGMCSSPYLIGNPSSLHSAGKTAKKRINEVTEKLFETFNLDPKGHKLFYHSGATEAVNTLLTVEPDTLMVCSESDHPCVLESAEIHQMSGGEVSFLEIDSKGKILGLEEVLKNNTERDIIVNITWMHNETGVIQDLESIIKLKEKYHFILHVDAVQTVGKIQNWNKLSPYVDAYTYSGHKFGSFKGIGFSFYKNEMNINPLIIGGKQQDAIRSGTLNTDGIQSLLWAVQDIVELEKLKDLKDDLLKIVSENSHLESIDNDSVNTICFVHSYKQADQLLIQFDMNGLCVSSGSACSSGNLLESKTLKNMGYEKRSKNAIRVSIGKENLLEKEELLSSFKKVISNL